jgi:hypothetical protein
MAIVPLLLNDDNKMTRDVLRRMGHQPFEITRDDLRCCDVFNIFEAIYAGFRPKSYAAIICGHPMTYSSLIPNGLAPYPFKDTKLLIADWRYLAASITRNSDSLAPAAIQQAHQEKAKFLAIVGKDDAVNKEVLAHYGLTEKNLLRKPITRAALGAKIAHFAPDPVVKRLAEAFTVVVSLADDADEARSTSYDAGTALSNAIESAFEDGHLGRRFKVSVRCEARVPQARKNAVA